MLACLIAKRWRDRIGGFVGATAAIIAVTTAFIGPAFAATPAQEHPGTCDKPQAFGADAKIRVTELHGRATVEVVKPNSGGRKLQVEYGDEMYVQKFANNGGVRISFALTAPSNEITLSMNEAAPITCKLDVADFNKIFRAVLRWHDPVQLELNVLEPGGRLTESGNVTGSQPNTDLDQGIGQMDLIGGIPADGATGEMSYFADGTAVPQDGVFGFKVDFVSRGARPRPPYCDAGQLAAPRVDFILIANGRVTQSKQTLPRAKCDETLTDRQRLMPIRQ